MGRGRAHACFGKWFTEKFSVNRFPHFPLRFSGQNQIFSVDFMKKKIERLLCNLLSCDNS
jgi:hypothetical protein